MRKAIILLITSLSFVPFLTKKSDYVDITSVISVSSICIDYNEENDNFSIYFYVLNNFNLAQAELSSSNVDTLAYITKIDDTDFTSAFEKFKKVSNVFVHYNHLQTLILTTRFFKKTENIDLFYQFIRNNLDIYPTFYLFTTDNKVEEIYQIKTFSDISASFTLLIDPMSSKSYELATYIDFVKAMNLDNYTLKIPHLATASGTTNKQDEPFRSIIIDGYSIYHQKELKTNLLETDLPHLHWLEALNNLNVSIQDYAIYIKEGKYQISKKEKTVTITYDLSATITKTINTNQADTYEILKKEITAELYRLYNYGIEHQLDLFNLNYLYPHQEIDQVLFNVRLDIN